MDHRILIAAVVGLVLVAFGGFYYALVLRSYAPAPPAAQTAAAGPPVVGQSAPGKTAPGAPAPTEPAAGKPAPSTPVPPAAVKPAIKAVPGAATPASIEAEIAASEHAELQALLKKNFSDEYQEMIKVAVNRRNEGVSDEVFGRELYSQIQSIMRAKLRFAAGADIAVIDRLAANEIELFHALAHEGAPFCLTVLGRDNTPPQGLPPDNVRRMLRLGTLYRFQAIAAGMPNFRPVEPLKPAEMVGFQAGLVAHGMTFDEVRNGAFLHKEGDEPGKACLMIERLYRTITELGDETRRKLFSGMFFLGRDK